MSNPYAPPPGGPDAAREQAEQERARRDQAHREGTGPHGTGPSHPDGHQEGSDGRPARPEPDPEKAAAASKRVMLFVLLLVAALVTASLPLPWQVAGVVFALASLVAGVRALHAVWRAGMRGALPAMVAVGLVFATLMTLSLSTLLALWPLQAERQSCLADALTISANEACEQQFQDRLSEYLDGVSGRTS